MKRRLCLIALMTMLYWPGETRAEQPDPSEEAVALGHAALTYYQEGNWAEALTRFEHANATMHSPVFELYTARCQRNLSLLREAAHRLEQLLARAPESAEPVSWHNARRDARAELEALRRRIPSVRVSAKGVSSASIDDSSVQPGEVVQLNPGKHALRAWSLDGRLASRHFTLREGEQTVTMQLAFDVPSTGKPPPLTEPTSAAIVPNPWRKAAWMTGGAAVAMALVATITGLIAKSRFDSQLDRCNGNSCPPDLRDDMDRTRLLANVSTAAFGLAALNASFGFTFALLPGGSSARAQAARR